MTIKIRLDDECENGHQDFSITGDIYQKGKPKTDRYFLSGGCIHEEILKVRPDLKIFVNLHLSDYDGVPMHPTANMIYFLKVGFSKTPIDSPLFASELCEYYRMNEAQYNAIKEARNEIDLSLLLQSTGVLKAWKDEATKAIEILENLTGKKFVNDSKRSQLVIPTDEAIKEEEQKVKSGYYSNEAKQARKDAERGAAIEKIEKERADKLNRVNLEFNAQKAVFMFGLPTNNFIFYSHSLEGCFNWKSYETQISQSQLDTFLSSEIYNSLCKGVKFYLSTKK